MRRIIVNIRYLFNSFLWILLQFKNENFKNYLKPTIPCRKMLILANGPSLADSLDSLLENMNDFDFCVVNNFCRSPYYAKLKPTMYVLADPLYLKEDMQRTNEAEIVELILKTDWKMRLYIPFYSFEFMKKRHMSMRSGVEIIPYHSINYVGWTKVKHYLYGKGLSMPRIQNVLVPSIFNAINVGYKDILLMGVDHSWISNIEVDSLNRVCLVDRHFYDNDNENDVVYSPWLKVDRTQYKMHEVLRDLSYMFESYHELKEYADKRKCNIYNCTPNSFIDAFTRF